MGMEALEASVQKLEKVSRVVQRMDDERRAVHSCTAPQGPLCKQWPRERPPVRFQLECEDAKLEPAAPRAVQAQQAFLFTWGHSPIRCGSFQRQGTTHPPKGHSSI